DRRDRQRRHGWRNGSPQLFPGREHCALRSHRPRGVGPPRAGDLALRASVERTGGGKDRFSAHLELGREAKGPRSHPAVAAGSWYTWAEFTRIPKSGRKEGAKVPLTNKFVKKSDPAGELSSRSPSPQRMRWPLTESTE